ncbi:MAG: DUF4065 domain-containing protein [Bacteroidaceae bacterium]|nr:DUF4065 domain-containing protein [Bacteroidaceae bacterium]
MESVEKIASYIFHRYQKEFGGKICEMKLHKLLYFMQRESIIQKNEPLFSEPFLAWRYGPVMVPIRNLYASEEFNELPSDDFIRDNISVFDLVFEQYAPKDAWSLSRLSHGELSWQHARQDLLPEQNGREPLSLEDIRKDAERVKMRRFLINKINSIQA